MDNRIYIFISHSHQDIDDVRVIRNYLESLEGGEPILFFLLSQTDKDKITSLIEQEINSRIWFIVCDSENARKSTWVQSEVEYAKKIGKHNIININLKEAVINHELTPEYKEKLRVAFEKFKRLTNIFISYSRKDYPIVKQIIDYLNKFGIHLFTYDDFMMGNIFESIENRIAESACVLSFLNDFTYVQQKEDEVAHKFNKPIYYVAINHELENSTIIKNYYEEMNISMFFFDANKIEESSDALVKWIFDNI